MTSLLGSVAASYAYRADGMRVAKQTGGVTTRYRHDGQMGFEDVETGSSGTTVTRYGLGARGVDLMERTVGTTVTLGYPLYDAHGNDVATLSRGGGWYYVSDRRSYDAWGVVRAQQSPGDPKLRYCANLGHKQDDESGLVYMRARYYEPTSGRFVSQDPSKAGLNWFAYCDNNPISKADSTGKVSDEIGTLLMGGSFAGGALVGYLASFYAVTAYLEASFPGFQATPDYYSVALGAFGTMAAAILLPSNKMGNWIKDADWATTARTCAKAFGVGLMLGAMYGAESARMSFEMWYGDNFDTVPW